MKGEEQKGMGERKGRESGNRTEREMGRQRGKSKKQKDEHWCRRNEGDVMPTMFNPVF